MAHPEPLLDLIRRTPAAAELLTWPFDFDFDFDFDLGFRFLFSPDDGRHSTLHGQKIGTS